MIVNGTFEFEELRKKLEAWGATIVWPDERRPVVFNLHCEVQDEDAYRHLPSEWLISDVEPDSDPADERDVCDFVAAVATRDQALALALAGRVFVTDRCQSACATALMRGAA